MYMDQQLLVQIAQQGLLGVFLVLVLCALLKKDSRVAELEDKRLEDMKSVKDEYVKVIVQLNATLDSLSLLIKSLK